MTPAAAQTTGPAKDAAPDLAPAVRREPVIDIATGPPGGFPSEPREAPPPKVKHVPGGSERELRLDLFRGIALWLIFIDHLPPNILTWFTIRNYGFSDATEIFIFISGYTAAFVYGRAMQERGFVVASARILKRVWQIYVAHVFLFTIYLAEISYVANSFENPLYAEEMGILDFLKQPDVTIIQALLLKFRPVNMDVLPLYIVLMVFLPPILWLLQRKADLALGLSVMLYAITWEYDLALPAYPNGVWLFNPFAWQLLFVFGAWCALGGARRMARILSSRITLGISIAYLIFAFCVTLTWYMPQLSRFMPRLLEQWMYPINKTDLDVLRFAHFLALAAITVRFLHKDWPGLKSKWLRPLVLCGQHSLEIFCLGVFLAFAGHFVLAEVAGGAWMHFAVSVTGIVVMSTAAWVFSWYKRVADKSGSRAKIADQNADMAGGEL
ncbi:OpgC domain-containing protein [Bradyrhizobium sp. U87765 SZCCT0131]|uniref:OpgC family protein n=1 Tax=unclassified Bradyrhizobium TaxID=2631580 RepID=UPI001BAA4848|nr:MULTISPECIES: OpgC domain-containing protein [unclassified Bradyrhizobium]MBR1221074.1 OpgC domain-containing protein [Bradyrhizobium sp. U87765 SZCCT0131]MBR1260106.1 OpgC domain-containing protein [Bradyrhizobium sp. U87765 SZCCT0134]MBR1307645.1 OpgC domain-containing protein [Bradyrhizobium sp. U87765 SZCCT0110]MBR1321599.1 OpgC domain-containing protein [Bradyrhizobium sp. U87765 SZCCT0109]MBR1349912.1 OpgC domain-containing protein [Bradyrhizobium sp. U87765 SZCCT0048]